MESYYRIVKEECMRERYITPIVVLIALAITSILNIVYKIEFYNSVIRLLLVLILFYIIGKVAERIIVSTIIKESISKVEETIEDDDMVDLSEETPNSL